MPRYTGVWVCLRVRFIADIFCFFCHIKMKTTTTRSVIRYTLATLCFSVFGLTVVGCANNSGTASYRIENWRNTNGHYTPNYALREKQKRAVDVHFFRQSAGGDTLRAPVNIYINGEYHTSLVNDAHSTIRLCPGAHTFSAYSLDAGNRYRAKHAGTPVTIGSDGPVYVEVIAAGQGAAQLRQSTAQAMSGLSRRQSHTISRVTNPKCG